MSLNPAMWSTIGAELFLWAALAVLFWVKGLRRRFPAMGYYLALRAISGPLMLILLHEVSQPGSRAHYIFFMRAYGMAFFAFYLAAAVLLFFICIEVFRSALAPFPGIARFAIVIFRWAAIVSVIVSLSSVSYAHTGLPLGDILYRLMLSVSILLLCVLAFLCLSMNTLRLSVRDLSFGIALGFGMMSSGDFIIASLSSRIVSLNDPVQFVYEALILAALATWTTYSILPEPARKPIQW